MKVYNTCLSILSLSTIQNCTELLYDYCGAPTENPTQAPSNSPSQLPTFSPSFLPTVQPTEIPTVQPSNVPSLFPTPEPTFLPTIQPTEIPTVQPSNVPSLFPTNQPTVEPTIQPSDSPLNFPTETINFDDNDNKYTKREKKSNKTTTIIMASILAPTGLGILIFLINWWVNMCKKNKISKKNIKNAMEELNNEL